VNQDPRNFPQAAREALHDPLLRPALGRLKTHFGAGRASAVARYGDFEALRARRCTIPRCVRFSAV